MNNYSDSLRTFISAIRRLDSVAGNASRIMRICCLWLTALLMIQLGADTESFVFKAAGLKRTVERVMRIVLILVPKVTLFVI